jgi:hypothetical protein
MGHASHESDPRASHRAAGSGDDARAATHCPPWSGASVQRSAPARSQRHPCARGGSLRLKVNPVIRLSVVRNGGAVLHTQASACPRSDRQLKAVGFRRRPQLQLCSDSRNSAGHHRSRAGNRAILASDRTEAVDYGYKKLLTKGPLTNPEHDRNNHLEQP